MTRLTHDEMAHELAKMSFAKLDWISKFSTGRNARGAHEIELKRRELAVLQQAKEDYQKAASRAA